MDAKVKSKRFLQGKIFVNTDTEYLSINEKNFILDLLDHPSVKKVFPSFSSIGFNLKLLKSSGDYDSYTFTYGSRQYLLKINDNASNVLKREFRLLEKLHTRQICPKPISFEKRGESSFLITTFDFGDSLKDLGRDALIYNISALAKHLSFMHELRFESDLDQTKDFFKSVMETSEFENNLSGDRISILSSDTSFLAYDKIKTKLLTDLNAFLDTYENEKVSICHLNLKSTNILFKEGLFKFINFKQSFYTNYLFDLITTVTQLQLEGGDKNNFIKEYYDSLGIEKPSYEDFLTKYKEAENIFLKLYLLKMINDRFYEQALFGLNRPLNYINFIENYESIEVWVQENISEYTTLIENIFYVY